MEVFFISMLVLAGFAIYVPVTFIIYFVLLNTTQLTMGHIWFFLILCPVSYFHLVKYLLTAPQKGLRYRRY